MARICRELLWTLSRDELWLLEKSLCSTDDPCFESGLSVEDQLNSINLDGDSKQKLSFNNGKHLVEPCRVSQSGSEYSEESCVMSHSVSTNTIVDTPETASDEVDAKHYSCEQDTSADRDSVSNLSTRLEEVSERSDEVDDSQDEAGCSSVGTRRLRHSQSWPEATHRRTRRVPQETTSLDVDCAASMEILEDIGLVESPSLARCTHSTGSREFCFHLPLNTGRDRGEQVGMPSIAVQEPSPGRATQQIILMDESTPKDEGQCDDGQVSYVTETLNQVFLTDPNFKGVLVSEWSQRPQTCARAKCKKLNGKCDGEHGSNSAKKSGKSKRKSGACQMNTGHTASGSVGPSNCDNSLTSCNRHPTPDSTSTHTNYDVHGELLEKENTETSEKDLQSTNRARFVGTESKSNAECLGVPKLHRGKPSDTVNCSRSHSPSVEYDWDRER